MAGFDQGWQTGEALQDRNFQKRSALDMLQRKFLADQYANVAARPLPDATKDPEGYKKALDLRAKALDAQQKVFSPEHHANLFDHIHGLITGQQKGAQTPPGAASTPTTPGTPAGAPGPDPGHPFQPNPLLAKFDEGIKALGQHLKAGAHPLAPAPGSSISLQDMAAASTPEERARQDAIAEDARKQQNALDLEKAKEAAKPEAANWQQLDLKFSDGTTRTVERNSKTGKYRTLGGKDLTAEELDGAQAQAKPINMKPVRGWKKQPDGSITSFLVDPKTNMAMPGTENPSILPPSYLVPKLSTGVYHWVDSDGQVHETPESRSLAPVLSPPVSSKSPTLPGNPLAAVNAGIQSGNASSAKLNKGKAPKLSTQAPPSPGSKPGDRVLGNKGTASYNKARSNWGDAVKLSSFADQVAQKPNDAVNQKRLAVQLERTSAGRFTTQALDYILKAGWGNTIDQWANNPTTGALPPDVMRQLIDGAHENLKSSKAEMDALAPPNSSKSPTMPDGKGSGITIKRDASGRITGIE